MRLKPAHIVQKFIELLASAGIGYAAGRIQQRARDEGRVGNANRRAEVNREVALSAQQAHIDYLKERTTGVKDEPGA